MRKPPPQDSQHPDQRDDLSSPVISVLTLKMLGVLTAVLGTACTLALASKPQQAPEFKQIGKPTSEWKQPYALRPGFANRLPTFSSSLFQSPRFIHKVCPLQNHQNHALAEVISQAQEQLKIEQQSLELAQQILEVNRALIEAGRVAPVDIVQSQTSVANRQVSLLTAQNNLEATKLALIDILDIEQNINIVAAETPLPKPITLASNKLMQLAFANRPDYLRAQLNQKTSQLQLLLAEDDKRWDLNLITSLNNTINSNSDVRAGLVLSREFGDLTKEQRFVRSRINLLQAENTLKDLNDSIKIQVTDRIRDVNLRFSQVERARQATDLSEKQLDIEREKQRLGRGSGIFEIVRLQNDLVSARNAELEATIEYLNALTRLDQTLGTTLQRFLLL